MQTINLNHPLKEKLKRLATEKGWLGDGLAVNCAASPPWKPSAIPKSRTIPSSAARKP